MARSVASISRFTSSCGVLVEPLDQVLDDVRCGHGISLFVFTNPNGSSIPENSPSRQENSLAKTSRFSGVDKAASHLNVVAQTVVPQFAL